MAIQQGDKIPAASLKAVSDEGTNDVESEAFFKGRKVVLFALPGAFTPTCSAQHLPGFVEHAEALKAKGVDEVACLSVNDAFVMEAWAKDRGALGKVTLLADGSGDFTNAMGLAFDATKFGMGVRSQRYALIADDGVITHLAVEEPMKFDVSKAEAILAEL